MFMEIKKLGDLVDFSNGYAFKSSDYIDSSNTVNCRMSNIRPDGTFDIEYNIKYLPDDFTNKYKDYILNDGDIIIAMTDMAGDPKILGVPTIVVTKGYSVLMNQRVGKLTLKNNDIVPQYLKYSLISKPAREYFKSFAGGGVQLNIGKKEILNIKLNLHNTTEQEQIVHKLDKIKEIIELRKQQLQQLDELVKARFVELFGDCKNRVRLGDCCDVHARIGWQALTKNEHMKTGEFMLVTGTDFKDGEINYSTCVYVAKERYEMDKHIILKNDDVLITKDGTIGKVAVVHNLPKPATLNAGVFVVRPDDRFNKTFIANVFRGTLFSDFVEDSKTGATIKHLNQKHLVEFMIPVPSINEQEQFADFVKQIDKSKFVVQKALDEAQTLFDSLMQEYFG